MGGSGMRPGGDLEVIGAAYVEARSSRAAPVGWVTGTAVGRSPAVPDAAPLPWSRSHGSGPCRHGSRVPLVHHFPRGSYGCSRSSSPSTSIRSIPVPLPPKTFLLAAANLRIYLGIYSLIF